MKYFLGIDGGTAMIRAAIYDQTGKMTASTSAAVSGSELDMIDFWEAAAAAVNQLMNDSKLLPEYINGIGVTGAPEGLWCLDRDNHPAFPAIGGNDPRSAEAAEELNEKTPGIGNLVHRTLGKMAGSGSTLLLLRDLKENRPEDYSRIGTVFFAKDWLRCCMTDLVNSDATDTGSVLTKFTNADVPDQLLRILRIPEAADMLPDVIPSTDWVGTLSMAAADKMGLFPGIPVAVSAGETASSVLGLGVQQPDDFVVLMDDDCRIVCLRRKAQCDPTKFRNEYIPYLTDDRALELVADFGGLKLIHWAIVNILGKSDGARIDAALKKVEPGAKGVVYFSAAGTGSARKNNAGFVGMSTETTKEEMFRAVAESIAYRIREYYEAVPRNNCIYLSLGKNAGTMLPQIIADIVGVTVICNDEPCIAAKGAALCGAVAGVEFRDAEEAAAKCCRQAKTYEPKPFEVYQDNYARYKALKKCVII